MYLEMSYKICQNVINQKQSGKTGFDQFSHKAIYPRIYRRMSVFQLFQNSGKYFGERDSVANCQPTILRFSRISLAHISGYPG